MSPGRRAPDGSPYPERGAPGFGRDVEAMFTHIAERYDWFDHLASLGQDYLWRPRALWTLERYRAGRPVRRFLDVGCGPGELTELAARRNPAALAVGLDRTPAMLRNAHRRAYAAPIAERLRFVRGDALRLPFPEGSFDLILSAFVARNLPDLPSAFAQFRRALAPGGTVLTLEITEPPSRAVRDLFHAYFDHVVPWLGAAVDSAGPYRYLPESLRSLPGREGFLKMMAEAGFVRTVACPQSLGVVTTYLGTAPEEGA